MCDVLRFKERWATSSVVERVTDNDEVEGSLPSSPTIMTISPHFFAGAALATFTSSPIEAFVLGFFSHFILDMIPHLEPGLFVKTKLAQDEPWPIWIYGFAAIEFIITLLVFYFLFSSRVDFMILFWGGIGGITLDIIVSNPITASRNWPIIKHLRLLHEKIHYNLPNDKWYWGALVSIIVLGGSLWWGLRY